MEINNNEFRSFLTANRNLFSAEELLVLESDDYSTGAGILLGKKHLLPSTTRASRLIFSMMQGDVNLSVVECIRANMFYPSRTAEQYLIYPECLGSVIYGAKHYTKRANMNYYMICYTFQGTGMLEYEGGSFPQNPGDAFLIDCRRPHFYYCTGNQWGYDVIHFNGNAVVAYYLLVKKSGNLTVHVQDTRQFMDSLDLLKAYCTDPSEYNEFSVHLALTSLLTTFTDSVPPSQTEITPDWLRAALAYIQSHYYENLNLEKIAGEVNISKYHLAKSIKNHTGVTFIKYLNHIRLEEAKKLLSDTNLPVSIISELVGFESESYFITLFKQDENITPLKFRKTR